MRRNLALMKKYILYGNGGHAKVLKNLIHLLEGEIVHIFDHDNPYDPQIHPDAELIIAVGDSKIRERISKEVLHPFAILIHPRAILANDVKVGEGTVILANTVIQPDSVIGKHSVINASVVIDHDVLIGDFVTIYPNTYIGGECRISDHILVEPNAVIKRKTVL